MLNDELPMNLDIEESELKKEGLKFLGKVGVMLGSAGAAALNATNWTQAGIAGLVAGLYTFAAIKAAEQGVKSAPKGIEASKKAADATLSYVKKEISDMNATMELNELKRAESEKETLFEVLGECVAEVQDAAPEYQQPENEIFKLIRNIEGYALRKPGVEPEIYDMKSYNPQFDNAGYSFEHKRGVEGYSLRKRGRSEENSDNNSSNEVEIPKKKAKANKIGKNELKHLGITPNASH